MALLLLPFPSRVRRIAYPYPSPLFTGLRSWRFEAFSVCRRTCVCQFFGALRQLSFHRQPVGAVGAFDAQQTNTHNTHYAPLERVFAWFYPRCTTDVYPLVNPLARSMLYLNKHTHGTDLSTARGVPQLRSLRLCTGSILVHVLVPCNRRPRVYGRKGCKRKA